MVDGCVLVTTPKKNEKMVIYLAFRVHMRHPDRNQRLAYLSENQWNILHEYSMNKEQHDGRAQGISRNVKVRQQVQREETS